MKYKVGDKVRIKSLDWYNENKNEYGVVELIGSNGWGFSFLEEMSALCGEVMTILNIGSSDCGYYDMKEDNGEYFWTDEMIEGLVEEESSIDLTVKGEEVKERIEITIPEGYEYVIESGKIIFTKKEKEMTYPKTYEECCKVLGVDPDNFLTIRNMHRYDDEEETTDYERDLLGKFDSLWELIICRDAYWKIAGEEMGLGKPWEPDWNTSEPKYVIAYTSRGIEKQWETTYCKGFAFPTAEMRDAFYENFKEEIEMCKELL